MERHVDPSFAETTPLEPTPPSRSAISHISTSSAVDEGRFVSGTVLGGRYRIIGLLGRGGMGEVYRATDLTLDQSVALKFLPAEAASNPGLLERFHGEVRVARQVSHPNVCRVYDIGEVQGMPFISMEYVDGEDLSSLLPRIGRLPADKALDAARKLCAGLAAAHDRGIIHRDLKPQNIMINKRGQVVIMDFGLAAIANQLSGSEARNGTPAYMSPEQLKGSEVTARSDIYALGLVLYELFTGKRPFDANNVQQLLKLQESAHLTSMTAIATDIDPAVEQVIRRCLQPDPNRRPPTALSVAAALPGGDRLAAALAAGETPSPELVAESGDTEGLKRRYAIPCLVAILICLIACIVFQDHYNALLNAGLEDSPEILGHKAHQIAVNFGYPQKVVDSDVTLTATSDLLSHLERFPQPHNWKEWFASEAPVRAEYHQSRSWLVAPPVGEVTWSNPPLTQSGMVRISLDGAGRLRRFAALPDGAAAPLEPPVTPEVVFAAAQLDLTKFEETQPAFTPPTGTDQLHSWKGPHPKIPGLELTVNLATWKGRVTHAAVDYGWKDAAAATPRISVVGALRGLVVAAFLLVGLVAVPVLARRNWKQGRIDRKGAIRVAIARFVLGMIGWLGVVHAAPDGSLLNEFLISAAELLASAAAIWLLLLALEPAVRAWWPHSLVTWNRIMAGRWKDPQVGAHILIGAATGSLMWLVVAVLDSTVKSQMHAPDALSATLGARQWLSVHASALSSSLIVGLITFFAIVGFRRLFRRDIVAALALSLLFSFSQGDVFNSPHWQFDLALRVGIFAVLISVLLRFGLVATVAAIFFLQVMDYITLGSDWKTWYAPSGLATFTLLAGVAIFAFNRALGNQPLFGKDLEA